MSEQEQSPQSKRNILSEFKTRIIGRPVDGAKKAPTFAIGINEKNVVTIGAYSNIENDRGGGRIAGRGDPSVLFMITALVRAAFASKGPFKRTIKHEDHVFMRGQRSERPMWIFDLCILRETPDDDVKLVLKSYNRADLEFYFRPTDFHQLADGATGKMLTVSEISEVYGLGWCNMVESVAGDLLEDYQVRMYGMPSQPTVDGKSAGLVMGSIANNPRITVFTNVEADQHVNKGMIPAKIDPPTFYAFAELVKKAVTQEPGWRVGIKNFGYGAKEANGRRGEKKHESTLVVGKDEESVIYVAVVDQDRSRPNIQFKLTPHQRFKVLDENDQELPLSKTSALMATGYHRLFAISIAKHLNTHYVPPDPSTWQNNGQRQGGGQQWGQQRQGGNSGQQRSGGASTSQTPAVITQDTAPPMEFDNDIPF